MASSVATVGPPLSTPLLIALVALKGYQETTREGKELYIEDLTQYLIDLELGGMDISRIALSGTPGRYWSEDIAQFVSEGIVFGDLKHKSPLEFTERCVEVCKNAIKERLGDNAHLRPLLAQAKQILDLNDLDL